MHSLTVLYDGWPLAYTPNSPAALHLLTLLAHLPPEVHVAVALPALPAFALPDGITAQIRETADTESGRLRWEQLTLPALASSLGAGLVHLTGGGPALFGSGRSVVSPTAFGAGQVNQATGRAPAEALPGRGFVTRLRDALAQGGMARARAVLWPNDLPEPRLSGPVLHLSPVVHPIFTAGSTQLAGGSPGLDLPESFVLYHGPASESGLRRMLEAWSWASDSIGEYYPLLVLGLDHAARARLAGLCAAYELEESVRALPAVGLETLAYLYQACAAVFHPAPVSPWGGPLRPALACGRPIIALETPLADALVGPAAYLVSPSPESNRALGAAILTVIVEENVSTMLSQAALLRATAWQPASFSRLLLTAYQSVLL